jgi:hypothetical protein
MKSIYKLADRTDVTTYEEVRYLLNKMRKVLQQKVKNQLKLATYCVKTIIKVEMILKEIEKRDGIFTEEDVFRIEDTIIGFATDFKKLVDSEEVEGKKLRVKKKRLTA